MSQYFISSSDFNKFVEKLLPGSKIIAPVEISNQLYLQEITPENIREIKLSGFRTIDSFKSWLFMVSELVSGAVAPSRPNKLIFLGVRGCDLEALEILDRVNLEDEFKDPYYAQNRSQLLIFGADCTDCGKTCFCTTVKGKPYPVKLFDLNLSPLENGYIIESGTARGKALIEANQNLFKEASQEQLAVKEENRRKVGNLLAENNSGYKLKLDLSEIHKRNLENKIWKVLTKDCVECSACNFICPTCTCFLLLDQKNEKYKVWDACLKAGYARVAGGANPRGKLYERLQNRYHCKFDYSFDRLARYTCVGCGRCIDGCAGNIDMRKIFVELERQVPLTAKLE